MTIQEKNKELSIKILEAMGNVDSEYLDSALSEKCKVWVPGKLPFSGDHDKQFTIVSNEATKDMFTKGYKFTVHAMTAEGNRVAIETESYGEMVNGKVYNNTYHLLFEFEDGKLITWKEYMDTDHARQVLFPEE